MGSSTTFPSTACPGSATLALSGISQVPHPMFILDTGGVSVLLIDPMVVILLACHNGQRVAKISENLKNKSVFGHPDR
jgi:hypothetical protein